MSSATTPATMPDPTDGPELPVVLARDGAVATVRLNRPEAMNALDLATKVALRDTLAAVAADPQVRCVVLTGTGRAFCVGQDLKEHVTLLRSADAENLGSTVREHYNPIALSIATMPKPVIAALNGVAAGAGASFAFGADLRVMAASGGINLAFTGIALAADSGASWWLPRLVGPAKAKELLMMPRTIPAAECLELGLVTQVVPDEAFTETVASLAQRLAAGPTLAYAGVRQSVEFSAGHTLAESLANESAHMDATGASADHLAAVDAFLARTPPQFTGR